MKTYMSNENNRLFFGIREDERQRIEKYTNGIVMLVTSEKLLNPEFASSWNKNDDKGLTILIDHVIAQVNDLCEGPQISTVSKMLKKLPYDSEKWEHIQQMGLLPDRGLLPEDANVAEFFDLNLESDDLMDEDELRQHRASRFKLKDKKNKTRGPSPMMKRA